MPFPFLSFLKEERKKKKKKKKKRITRILHSRREQTEKQNYHVPRTSRYIERKNDSTKQSESERESGKREKKPSLPSSFERRIGFITRRGGTDLRQTQDPKFLSGRSARAGE